MKNYQKPLLAIIIVFCSVTGFTQNQLAFPTAEGYGKYTVGGRAGQTAPGDESGDATDAVSSRYTNNIILDHISASWSIDETFSICHCKNITVQWCMITESMYHSNHVKSIQ